VTCPSACRATVVARQGKRVVGRGEGGAGKVVVKLTRRVRRGKLMLTLTVGATTLTQTVRVR
jgi:hypothetical protein